MFKLYIMLGGNWILFQVNGKKKAPLFECLKAAEQKNFPHYRIKHPTEERVLLGFRFDSDPGSIFWRLEGGRNKPFDLR